MPWTKPGFTGLYEVGFAVICSVSARYGAQYGGPNFNEAEPASQGLHLEEYFHTESSSSLVEDADGNLVAEELPWNRSSNPSKYKWCSHVDPFLLNGSAILLQARCGLGDYRPADGFGLVTGFSTSGGRFVYDGLVTTVDRWFRPHFLKLRRFRFVGNAAVGPAGDVRVFMLSPSLPGSETPTVVAWPRKHCRERSWRGKDAGLASILIIVI